MPEKSFQTEKFHWHLGTKPLSGRFIRYFKAVVPKPALIMVTNLVLFQGFMDVLGGPHNDKHEFRYFHRYLSMLGVGILNGFVFTPTLSIGFATGVIGASIFFTVDMLSRYDHFLGGKRHRNVFFQEGISDEERGTCQGKILW